MTSTRLTRSTSELTEAGGALDLGPDRTRLATRIFRLLAEGRPITAARADRTIAELGVDPDQARQLLEAWTERNEAGDVVGLGVSLNETPHQMTIGDAHVYAWCAMDTMILAIILNQPITVASAAPGTGHPVRLTAHPDGATDPGPAGAVITWPARRAEQVDLDSTSGIWATFCHHSFFFPSREQAQQWATGHDDIEILSLDEGFAVARDIAAAWLRYDH
ncbi:MAG: organomercurial lyase [Micromonosporaceae bacterium]